MTKLGHSEQISYNEQNASTHYKTHNKASGLLEDHEKLAMFTNAVVTQSYNLKDDS